MNTTGKLRDLAFKESYWEEVQSLDWEHFPRPWNPADWSGLNFDQHDLTVWEVNGRAVGFALFQTADNETAHLLKILLIPEFRGTGESVKFWIALVKGLKEKGYGRVYLEVEESNTRARGYYQKLGFEFLRRVKSYYSDGEIGIMMQLTL